MLATLRYGMLDHLLKPISGFKRATNAHFYYKRDEIKRVAKIWLEDVQNLAIYENYLYRKVKMMKEIVDIAMDKEWNEQKALWDTEQITKKLEEEKAKEEKAKEEATKEQTTTTTVTNENTAIVAKRSSASSSSSSTPTFKFKPSTELADLLAKVLAEEKNYRAWVTETTLSCHTVFKRGLGTISPSSIQEIESLINEKIHNSDLPQMITEITEEVASFMKLSTEEITQLANPEQPKESNSSNTTTTTSTTTTTTTTSSSSSSSTSSSSSSTTTSSNKRYAFQKTSWSAASGSSSCSSYQYLNPAAHAQLPMIDIAAATDDAVKTLFTTLDKLTENDLIDDEFME